MVVLNPAAEDFDAFVEHLAIPHRARRAYWHLRLSGAAAVPALRRGLEHPNAVVRSECVAILDRSLDDEALPDIVRLLDDPDPVVVGRALHTLACDECKEGSCRPGENLFVPKAIDILQSYPHPRVRFAAADALGKVVHHNADALSALEAAAVNDPERGVRKGAALRIPGGSIYERTKPRARPRAD